MKKLRHHHHHHHQERSSSSFEKPTNHNNHNNNSHKKKEKSHENHNDSSNNNKNNNPCQISNEMKQRMASVMRDRGNSTCVDCPRQQPAWASFLDLNKTSSLGESSTSTSTSTIMGVLCCDDCAQHHYFELGSKRCKIKALKMAHEWTMEDVMILQKTGNDFVNQILEATLTRQDFDKMAVAREDEEEEERRAQFVKHKYKKLRYTDMIVFHEAMLRMLKNEQQQQKQSSSSNHTTTSSLPYNTSKEDFVRPNDMTIEEKIVEGKNLITRKPLIIPDDEVVLMDASGNQFRLVPVDEASESSSNNKRPHNNKTERATARKRVLKVRSANRLSATNLVELANVVQQQQQQEPVPSQRSLPAVSVPTDPHKRFIRRVKSLEARNMKDQGRAQSLRANALPNIMPTRTLTLGVAPEKCSRRPSQETLHAIRKDLLSSRSKEAKKAATSKNNSNYSEAHDPKHQSTNAPSPSSQQPLKSALKKESNVRSSTESAAHSKFLPQPQIPRSASEQSLGMESSLKNKQGSLSSIGSAKPSRGRANPQVRRSASERSLRVDNYVEAKRAMQRQRSTRGLLLSSTTVEQVESDKALYRNLRNPYLMEEARNAYSLEAMGISTTQEVESSSKPKKTLANLQASQVEAPLPTAAPTPRSGMVKSRSLRQGLVESRESQSDKMIVVQQSRNRSAHPNLRKCSSDTNLQVNPTQILQVISEKEESTPLSSAQAREDNEDHLDFHSMPTKEIKNVKKKQQASDIPDLHSIPAKKGQQTSDTSDVDRMPKKKQLSDSDLMQRRKKNRQPDKSSGANERRSRKSRIEVRKKNKTSDYSSLVSQKPSSDPLQAKTSTESQSSPSLNAPTPTKSKNQLSNNISDAETRDGKDQALHETATQSAVKQRKKRSTPVARRVDDSLKVSRTRPTGYSSTGVLESTSHLLQSSAENNEQRNSHPTHFHFSSPDGTKMLGYDDSVTDVVGMNSTERRTSIAGPSSTLLLSKNASGLHRKQRCSTGQIGMTEDESLRLSQIDDAASGVEHTRLRRSEPSLLVRHRQESSKSLSDFLADHENKCIGHESVDNFSSEPAIMTATAKEQKGDDSAQLPINSAIMSAATTAKEQKREERAQLASGNGRLSSPIEGNQSVDIVAATVCVGSSGNENGPTTQQDRPAGVACSNTRDSANTKKRSTGRRQEKPQDNEGERGRDKDKPSGRSSPTRPDMSPLGQLRKSRSKQNLLRNAGSDEKVIAAVLSVVADDCSEEEKPSVRVPRSRRISQSSPSNGSSDLPNKSKNSKHRSSRTKRQSTEEPKRRKRDSELLERSGTN